MLFRPPVSPPPLHLAPGLSAEVSEAALRFIEGRGAPAPLVTALSGPAASGRLGVLYVPEAFDPVVYVALRRTGEVLYVGRTTDLPARMTRHRRDIVKVGAQWPEVWAAVRVAAPDAPPVEEGLIRHLQSEGCPAMLLRTRERTRRGLVMVERDAEALRRYGML